MSAFFVQLLFICLFAKNYSTTTYSGHHTPPQRMAQAHYQKKMSLLLLHNYSARYSLSIITLGFTYFPLPLITIPHVLRLYHFTSDSKLITRICCAVLFIIGCIFLYDFYKNNHLPPQRGFYIITSIDAEKLINPRHILRKKTERNTFFRKLNLSFFRKVTKILGRSTCLIQFLKINSRPSKRSAKKNLQRIKTITPI